MTTLDVQFRGGALDRMKAALELEDNPGTWPPDFLQIDYADARWGYRRVPGERSPDGDHLFECTGRERHDMLRMGEWPDGVQEIIPRQSRFQSEPGRWRS